MRTLSTYALSVVSALLLTTCTALPQEVILHGPIKAPIPIKRSDPEYTPEARAARLEGAVIVSTVVGVDGVPSEIKVVRGLGMGLDEKAVESVRRWRFKPGMRDGEPVPVKVNLEVQFRLSGSKPTPAR